MPDFSFIILTYNEEVHLPRLLNSIIDLKAKIFILDSGSSDETLKIAQQFNAQVKIRKFDNHPKQWHYALNNFVIEAPWVIGLDADQVVSSELFNMLSNFKNKDYNNVNGIYFNRKNYFQGKWIKYGGYFPFYLLKMFRTEMGYSDLNENMDHRFIVSGRTIVWKKGFLIEENLKENDLNFWIEKHKRYSDRVAEEEFERLKGLRIQTLTPSLLGNPDERTAWLKRLWWRLPLGIRPYLYFSYRMLFKLGILDGTKGIYFHYLHALWFRKLIDKKIMILKKGNA
jgi:glycosyltransferase involved in cell wall biosynthesis